MSDNKSTNPNPGDKQAYNTTGAYAAAEMAQRGLDLTGHGASSITHDLVDGADLVLVMTRNHADALRTSFPRSAHKVHLLSEMVGKKYDISDPYGGSPAEYACSARELEELVESGYERIVSLAEEAGRDAA